MAKLTRVRDLDVYRLSFSAAMAIFSLSKRFPPDERFSLTDAYPVLLAFALIGRAAPHRGALRSAGL